jgi:hypothetical protein
MSKGSGNGELSRRNVLLAGTILAAASAFSAAKLDQAQAQNSPHQQ